MTISVKGIALPTGVSVRSTKTMTVFDRNGKKLILKGKRIEATSYIKTLKRLKKLTDKQILSGHLGKVRAVGIVDDAVHLAKFLKRYFRSK